MRDLYRESESYPIYEGRIGASPREMRAVILDAAQSHVYRCLSPLAVCDEIEALCTRKNEFEWLQQDTVSGGYHDVKLFREALSARLLSSWETELYASSGLVDDVQYADLFERYVQHVSVWVKKERIRNRATGDYEEPDEKTMREVERLIEVKGDVQDARRALISGIAAWAIDHPGQKVEAAPPCFRSTCGACGRRSSTIAARRWPSSRATWSSWCATKGPGSTRTGSATPKRSSGG